MGLATVGHIGGTPVFFFIEWKLCGSGWKSGVEDPWPTKNIYRSTPGDQIQQKAVQ